MSSLSKKIRKNILLSSHLSGHGHIPTSFSIIEILIAVYKNLNRKKILKNSFDRDIFILSKGHAAIGYYCTLAELGFYKKNLMKTFGSAGSKFGCHPDRKKQKFTEVSCGSLGHGLGVACGIALASKIKKINRKIICLVGDGESNEGTVWEAALVASDQRLNNLTILYDNNNSQTRCLQIKDPKKKFESFGFKTFFVDGHDEKKISSLIKLKTSKPKCIICNTKKGYGSKTLMNNFFEWHRRSPNKEELKLLTNEIDEKTI